jgi:hypothetical protein
MKNPPNKKFTISLAREFLPKPQECNWAVVIDRRIMLTHPSEVRIIKEDFVKETDHVLARGMIRADALAVADCAADNLGVVMCVNHMGDIPYGGYVISGNVWNTGAVAEPGSLIYVNYGARREVMRLIWLKRIPQTAGKLNVHIGVVVPMYDVDWKRLLWLDDVYVMAALHDLMTQWQSVAADRLVNANKLLERARIAEGEAKSLKANERKRRAALNLARKEKSISLYD